MIVPYDFNKHGNKLEEFIKARDMPIRVIDQLPRTGLVALTDRYEPIAFGFIRMIEGTTGMIDSFITHPDTPPHFRDKALNLLTQELIVLAKKLNLTSLIALTKDNNTLIRAHRHGFVSIEHKPIVLDLTS